MKQNLKMRNIILITVEFDTNTKSRFVRSFNRLSKIKKFPVVYITMYQKESDENVYLVISFFHWLEIEQIEKIST